MQKLSEPVLAFAKQLELDNKIPTNHIAQETKKAFKDQCCPDTISNILKSHPHYFNKKMVRKQTRKQSAKNKLISLIKLIKEDDPRIESLLSEVAEPLHLAK